MLYLTIRQEKEKREVCFPLNSIDYIDSQVLNFEPNQEGDTALLVYLKNRKDECRFVVSEIEALRIIREFQSKL